MKTLRKYFSLLLCFCVSTYALPAFATTAVKGDFVKVELSDTALDQAVGGNGSVDATMSDFKSGSPSAVIAYRSTETCSYTMSVVDMNGAVVETFVEGSIAPGTALVISGTPVNSGYNRVQTRVWSPGVPGIESLDASFGDI